MTINKQKRAKIPSCSENDAIAKRKRKENDRNSGGKKKMEKKIEGRKE